MALYGGKRNIHQETSSFKFIVPFLLPVLLIFLEIFIIVCETQQATLPTSANNWLFIWLPLDCGGNRGCTYVKHPS